MESIPLHELRLEYPADPRELELLKLTLDSNEGTVPDTVSSTTTSTVAVPQSVVTSKDIPKRNKLRTALVVTLVAIVAFVVISIPPIQTLTKRLHKGPIRLLVQVVTFSIVAWVLYMLLL